MQGTDMYVGNVPKNKILVYTEVCNVKTGYTWLYYSQCFVVSLVLVEFFVWLLSIVSRIISLWTNLNYLEWWCVFSPELWIRLL
jgi:hypothetical protein